MKIRYDTIYLSTDEISDLLGKDAIEGPLLTERIKESDTTLDAGYERCRERATEIARRNNMPIITKTFDAWYNGTAEMEFAFYRFKSDSKSSSSSKHR